MALSLTFFSLNSSKYKTLTFLLSASPFPSDVQTLPVSWTKHGRDRQSPGPIVFSNFKMCFWISKCVFEFRNVISNFEMCFRVLKWHCVFESQMCFWISKCVFELQNLFLNFETCYTIFEIVFGPCNPVRGWSVHFPFIHKFFNWITKIEKIPFSFRFGVI